MSKVLSYTKKPIIFIGTGRCGSTMIFGIISHHEQLGWPPNFTDKWPNLPVEINLGRRFSSKSFKPAENFKLWNRLTSSEINFRREFLLINRPDQNEVDRINKYFSKLVKYQGKKRLAFKITGPSRIGYLKTIFSDAVYVNIVRDVLPTINSWLNVPFWKNRGMHQLWWHGAYTPQEEQWAINNKNNSVLLAALQYKKIVDTTQKEIQENNVECLTIKYEDFVQNPKEGINHILKFVNLPQSPAIDNYMQTLKVENKNKDFKKIFSEDEINNVFKIVNGEYAYNQ